MKLLKACIIVLALCVCRFGYSQTAADVQIVAATYGAGSAQIDVTAKVRRLVEAGQTVQVNNELAGGADPAVGKVKTLTIVYVENGQRKVATATEGETLVYDKEPNTMTDSADTENHKSAVSPEQTKQANPQQLYDIQAQGFQATCTVLQGVERGSIVKVFAPKEIVRQVRQPRYYDPLGNMGRGEQRYYNQTVKEIKLVLITERAFVA